MSQRSSGYGAKRDMLGYGESPPNPQWPNKARLALSLVINYEEGGESCIENGDSHGETQLHEHMEVADAPEGQRLLASESMYEYGSRVGIWRLIRILRERKLCATVWAVGRAVEKNPLPIIAMHKSGFEIASHHYRWIDYQSIPESVEREHIKKSITAIETAIGKRPVGFFHWCGTEY